MSYKQKYIKYKSKYLKLKSEIHQLGGDNMKTAIDTLLGSSNKSFSFVNIGLTDYEKELLQSLQSKTNIEHSLILNYYGVYDHDKLYDAIYNFILKLGYNIEESQQIANIILTKVTKPYLKAQKHDSLWFTIRFTVPNDQFEIPRWHVDGFFYKSHEYIQNNMSQMKLAGVLYGPGTLFKKDNIEMRKKYYENLLPYNPNIPFDDDADIENRKKLEEVLVPYETIQPSNDQVAIFIVGKMDQNAVHSEPNMTTNRFFFSIVSGNKDDIKNLATDRKQIFIE